MSTSTSTSSLHSSLASIVQPSPSSRFVNWAGTFSCRPARIYHPHTEQEIQSIVELAKREGKCVRAFGAGHSPSDLVCVGEDDWLVCMDGLNRVIEIDRESGIATVEAGIRLRDLHPILAAHNLAISSLGSISDQSLGGAISTATHGSSLLFGNLSSFVVSLSLVTAEHDIPLRSVSRESEDEHERELFEASRCGLGMTGIITRVGIQCEPAFRLEEEEFSMRTDDFIAALRDDDDDDDSSNSIARSAQHIQGWWHPQAGEVSLSRMNRTSLPLSVSSKRTYWTRFIDWVRDRALGYHWHQIGLLIGRVWPDFLTAHARFMYFRTIKTGCILDTEAPVPAYSFRSGNNSSDIDGAEKLTPPKKDPSFPRCSDTVKRVGQSVSIFNYDCLFPQYTYEGVVPLARARSCLREMQRWLEGQCTDKGGMRHHFPIEIRFAKSDDVWMSPTNGMDGCYIGIVQYKPYGLPVTYRALFTEFERLLFAHGGKPHWAKSHSCTPEMTRAMFPRTDDFLRVCARADPQGVFRNPYATRHFFGEVGDEVSGGRFKTTAQRLEERLKMQ